MRSIAVALAVLAAAAFIPSAFGQTDVVKVQVWYHGTNTYTYYYDEDEDFSIAFVGNMEEVFIYAPDGPVWDIGRVTFTGTLNHEVRVQLGSGVWDGDDTAHTHAAKNWKGMAIQNSAAAAWVQFEGGIAGNLTNTLTAGQIHRFDVGGEVQAGVVALNSAQSYFIVEAGGITHPGNIYTAGGPILRVHTTGDCDAAIEAAGNIGDIIVGGNMYHSQLGDDIVAGGSITHVQVTGVIGSAEHHVEITAESGGISHIEGQSIYADISAANGDVGLMDAQIGGFAGSVDAMNVRYSGSQGFLAHGDVDLALTLAGGVNPSIRDDFIITGGDFTQNSSIYAWGIGDAGVFSVIRSGGVGGYLKGDITFTGNLSPQSPFTIDESLEGTLSIGNNLWDTVTINGISSGGEGLVGQVIVNAVNGGGQWLSPVVVGSTTLSPQPYYDDSSADLGGGAVGQVPYYLHYADCTPNASKVNEDPNTGHDGYDPSLCNGFHVDKRLGPGELLQYVTLSHYGPIGLHGSGMPVTIKRRTMLNPCGSWTDVTSSFSFLMHPNGAEREIRLSGPIADGFIYWIQPNSDDESSYLSCGGLDPSVGEVSLRHDDSDPDLAYGYDFVMRVRRLQDINLNGLLQPEDISA